MKPEHLYYAGRWCLKRGFSPGARFCEFLSLVLFSCLVPASTSIGKGLRLGHRGVGVVISKHASLGDDCLVRAHVVIGGSGGSRRGAPVIEDGVQIGVGAKILGPVTIGSGSVIGANAVVISDVPAGVTAVGIPARILGDAK